MFRSRAQRDGELAILPAWRLKPRPWQTVMSSATSPHSEFRSLPALRTDVGELFGNHLSHSARWDSYVDS
jgi:hypothetical protein